MKYPDRRPWALSIVFAASVLCLPTLAVGDEPAPAAIDGPLPRVSALEPEQASESFRLLDGFRIELIAAEPLVTDPVAMRYDENGRAYVVEMNDYPYTDEKFDVAWEEQQSSSIGRVRLLEDRNGDGRFDSSTVFADGLSWPSGLALWKGGVFVTATPDVWYFKDTDGDGEADVRQKVFTGFRKFNVQAVMNNPVWGLDHRIYAAGASNGGQIRRGKNTSGNEEPEVVMRRHDFRIDPVTRSFELLSGGARFGNTFDDFGNRFICNIRNPVQHVVLPRRYLARNDDLAVTQTVHNAAIGGDVIPVYRASPPEAWRVINAQRLAANRERQSPRSETAATGYVTSSSGITIYRGAAYPRQYYGNAFVGEVAGNLVMRYGFESEGPTFVARRIVETTEFLASTDNWFRPVNFVNAPDGTLHVLDMYRETIEHPWSMPDDIKARLDLRSGHDRGRIYRLAPPNYPDGHDPTRRPRLGEATIGELVAELENPNAWWRETAHRLIFERQDPSAIGPLRELLAASPSALARLHALWSLKGLDALTDADLLIALDDESPPVREHAIRLAEDRLRASDELRRRVLAAAEDGDVRVRFQTALSLGECLDVDPESVLDALAVIARRNSENQWLRTAVLSSLAGSELAFIERLLDRSEATTDESVLVMAGDVAEIIGARNVAQDVLAMLDLVGQMDSELMGVVVALGNGLRRARTSLDAYASDETSSGAALLRRLFQIALRQSTDTATLVHMRIDAVRLLGHLTYDQAAPSLVEILDANQPLTLQLAAVNTLGSLADERVPDVLLEAYQRATPSVRNEIVTVLLSRPARTRSLLAAIRDGRVAASQVSPLWRGLLLRHREPDIRQRAEALFASLNERPRDEVIARYRAALGSAADAKRGEAVFRRECVNCHRLGNDGHDVGINLATVRSRTPDEILVHVLDPNREVSPAYLEYVAITDDGRTQTGIISEETAAGVTLRRAGGLEETIPRWNIETIQSSGLSLMPEGLEQKITPGEMADLLAFLSESSIP